MKLTHHAKLRIRERTKLSPEECQLILDLTAYVYLGSNLGEHGVTEYLLFLDPRSYQYFVACIRDTSVVTVMCEHMIMPVRIRTSVTPKNKKIAEAYFYDRAAYRLLNTFRATLDVYLVVRRSRKIKIHHEAHLCRIDREGFMQVKDADVVEIFRADILSSLVGKKSLLEPGYRVSIELRQMTGDVVRNVEYVAKDICRLLVSDEVLYDTTVKVVGQREAVTVPFGIIPATHLQGKVPTVLYFEERIQEIVDLLERRLSWKDLLHIEYHFHSVHLEQALPDRMTSIWHNELSAVFFNHTP